MMMNNIEFSERERATMYITVGSSRMVAREPSEPSPIAILRNFTGGLGVEKMCFVM